jgi:alpha-mannosidase
MDLPTPDAQCPGRHTFELAVRPHAGDWRTICRDAAVFAAPLYVRRGDETEGYLPGEVWPETTFDPPLRAFALKPRALTGDLPGELSFLSLSPAALVLSAVKRSEDGEALIVRCYNPTAEALPATLDMCWPVERADLVSLDEKRLVDAPTVETGRIRFAIGPKQVRTIAVRFAGYPGQPRP